MSSLYEQLTSSGGVESGTKPSTSSQSYYHTSRDQSNLSRFDRETNRVKKRWADSGGSPWPAKSKRKEREDKKRTVIDVETGNFYQLKTDRPYAYQPARDGVSPPTFKEIFIDFFVFAAETMLAAFGHALMEFFLYSRFRPQLGVKY